MASRKAAVQKLERRDGKSKPVTTEGVPVAKPARETLKSRELIAPETQSGIVGKLLGRIHEHNAPLDYRKGAPVTVVIPAWLRNDQDVAWLLEAVESVIAQTVSVKCIVVENGSELLPDTSGNISIIHSDKGLSKARNAGIRASETELFFPLDANDWLPESAIEIAFSRMPDKGFLYGSTMLFTGERGAGDQHLYDAKPYDFSEVMKMVYFPNGALQRKADWEKISGYRESLPFLEDWDYWMTAGELGVCGTAIPDTLYWYRQHGGIVMTNNHTPEWEATKRLIQSYHKEIYKGRFPPMCCGNKAVAPSVPYVPPSMESLVPGADGMILIEYRGGNAGKTSWYGAVTGTRYVFGGIAPANRRYIDERDAVTGLRANPGFLEILEYGSPIFVKVDA